MAGDVRDPRLFDYDPLTGITEFYHFDPETEGFTIQTQQDVELLIETNKALANDDTGRYGEWNRIASIPLVIVMELAKQGIMTAGGAILDEPRFKKWLNDPDNRAFRVKLGKV